MKQRSKLVKILPRTPAEDVIQNANNVNLRFHETLERLSRGRIKIRPKPVAKIIVRSNIALEDAMIARDLRKMDKKRSRKK
ncbi:MAG: hypothetical protein HOE11_02020 [Candidatus Diapherotrites archaeon]|nr:hypothetical protein [Candidatus Diapherotrites archaeon]MBT4596900.1 hypothetical protein [Candidatus Diapherotrites archaeon]